MDDVRRLASPLRTAADLDPLLDRIGDARIVLLGEASHGTHEYYAWRADLTRRLVEERGFGFVAVEGDWPECYEVNRCVRLRPGAPTSPRTVLEAFDRWPTWMWANEEVVAFAEWLREHNAGRPEQKRTGFYGLDVYSLRSSMQALLDYLREHEPQHVDAALAAVRCFEPYGEDPSDYAFASSFSPTTCEPAVVELLTRLCQERLSTVDGDDPEARFSAEQNAAVAAGAERYYRTTIGGQAESWNVRDVHMQDTLDRLLDHTGGKAVVWEHNTHIGDARATDMAGAGMVNVGQLARERHGRDQVVAVGFGGYRGGVVAARRWGGQVERMPVPPGRRGSVEDRLHDALGEDSLLVFPPAEQQPDWLRRRTDHRAIGVVYAPEREAWGNYVPTVLGERYDAFLWFERTNPLAPLHGEPEGGGEEQTWPWAL
ncbi:MAG: erythromycin esterase family protein [Actinomycetota bacterium]|nr:erythromycin esterase family protein [Actinomycetota bacterium]